MEHFQIFNYSVNIERFIDYLQGLRSANEGEQICIFMDNLGVHVSEDTKKEMRRLQFRWIYNVPYSPEYNPIEFAFAKIKARFRSLRARKLAGLDQGSTRSLVAQAVECIRK